MQEPWKVDIELEVNVFSLETEQDTTFVALTT